MQLKKSPGIELDFNEEGECKNSIQLPKPKNEYNFSRPKYKKNEKSREVIPLIVSSLVTIIWFSLPIIVGTIISTIVSSNSIMPIAFFANLLWYPITLTTIHQLQKIMGKL